MKKITTTCDGVGTIFDYEEFALFALLVSNRLAMARIAGHRNDIRLIERASAHINAFLDEIDNNQLKSKNEDQHRNLDQYNGGRQKDRP